MSQELQAETHVRARVVVGNRAGGGRAGAIRDQAGNPLKHTDCSEPTSSQREASRRRLIPVLRQVLTRLMEKPTRGAHELGQTQEYKKTPFYLKPERTHQSPPPQLLSLDSPYSILVAPDLPESWA